MILPTAKRSVLFAGLNVVVWVFLSVPVLSQRSDLARENPLLRRYFLERAEHLASVVDRAGRQHNLVSPVFLDLQVDKLVDRYLKEVDQELFSLKHHFQQANDARLKMLGTVPGTAKRRALSVEWKGLLTQLSKQADDLRKTLSVPLVGMDSKEEFHPAIGQEAEQQGFEQEMNFIGEQIEKAEEEISDYFLAPTHTVSVSSLSGANMLISLYRVHRMSKQLVKQI